jgi:ubiquinone/menaquinone biosynthesis C-methylase UbiE
MKSTGNSQINTRTYWNFIYTNKAKEVEYWSSSGRYEALLNEIKDNEKFIDIGCGVGIPGRLVLKERKGCEIWGVDISTEIIEKNKKEGTPIKYYSGYAGYNDFLPSNYFTSVFSGELIEHLDDPSVLFKEAYRILKKKGRLIISTPHDNAVTSPEHVWEFNNEDIIKFYTDAGFKNVEFRELKNMEHLVIIFAVGVK